MGDLNFFNEYGYLQDMEPRLREIGISKNSLSIHTANQIKHLKDSLRELISIVEIHQEVTKSKFAWAELDEAKLAMKMCVKS